MAGWHHRLDGREFGWTPGVGDGQGGLACFNSWGRKESDMTERLHFHFSLSCIGEANGNPLQCSCLENPRDREAWWAAIYVISHSSVQFSSIIQSCLTLCDPTNRSTPGLPVHHQLPEFTQTHVHPVGDAIQPSHPLSSPSPPAPNPSQHQSLFQ